MLLRAGELVYSGGMTSPSRQSAADDVREDDLTRRVIGCAITVHRTLGCGLLESAYDECLAYELVKNGFGVSRHVTMPIIYDGLRIELGYRPDLIIDGELIVELKTVSQLLAVHEAHLLTYLRLSGITRGLLMNFHSQPLAKGIRRMVLSHTSP